jgi:Nif-specific regulatory protein
MQRLVDYDWPGNVRELENAIERACVLGSSDQILQEDLPDSVMDAPATSVESSPLDLHASVSEAKRQAVISAFIRARRSYTETAKLLGVHPNYLHRLIRNLKIKSVLEGEES